MPRTSHLTSTRPHACWPKNLAPATHRKQQAFVQLRHPSGAVHPSFRLASASRSLPSGRPKAGPGGAPRNDMHIPTESKQPFAYSPSRRREERAPAGAEAEGEAGARSPLSPRLRGGGRAADRRGFDRTEIRPTGDAPAVEDAVPRSKIIECASARSTAFGSCSMTNSNVRASPSGCRRPCSQSRSVSWGIANRSENSSCVSLRWRRILLTFTCAGT
jgi:hypothetical protein